MNRVLGTAGLLLVCAVMNLYSFVQTKNGFSFAFGLAWFLGSIVLFVKYRKEKMKAEQEDENG